MDIPALLARLGDISIERLVTPPAPGTATVADVIARGKPACELVEGTLIRRPSDFALGCLFAHLGTHLFGYTRERNLGIVTNPIAPVEILPGVVRAPDLAFTSWDRLPGRRITDVAISPIAPDLVVSGWRSENTVGEMARKRSEYFRGGVTVQWELDRRARTVRVYTSETAFTDLTTADALSGDPVLPGFVLPLAQLFAELDRRG
jgi:Uma2 family endonuclease